MILQRNILFQLLTPSNTLPSISFTDILLSNIRVQSLLE